MTRWGRRLRSSIRSAIHLALGYKDECTTLSFRYSSNVSQPAIFSTFPGGPTVLNPSTRNQTLMIQLVLRTLGDVRTNVGL